ncbi:MAG: DUF393 domain-containing protein [Planctomycetes bacterium]|nr:DUF393 domain-containing protein [Planctomycetota bacterium]
MTKSHNNPTQGYGWLFYDEHCPRCSRWVGRFKKVLLRKHILTAPLQRGWVQERLELDADDAFTEMRVLTASGKVLGGASAMVYLAERIWFAKPLAAIAKLPGVMGQLDRLYGYIAHHRNCQSTNCKVAKPQSKHSTSKLRSEPRHEADRAA